MTYRGKLLPEAYTALWNLSRSGMRVIPVTGRPAGWCDLIARFWPVAGVIGENGAFAFYMEENRMKRMYHPLADREGVKDRLDGLWERVHRAVPESRIAADQFSRLFDLAVDYREEPPLLDDQAADGIKKACEAEGARAKISSIHVNAWFGDYDKLSMTQIFFSQRYPEANMTSDVLFVGDSPNDEPMFAFFPLSCGVGNIRNFLPSMKVKPAFITSGEGSYGFAELAERLLSF
ncbi:MAG: HAD family phosphatase [Spirochaetales bacterium]|nr:HAD family phosphatase [Spirochaetales bacterium]